MDFLNGLPPWGKVTVICFAIVFLCFVAYLLLQAFLNGADFTKLIKAFKGE